MKRAVAVLSAVMVLGIALTLVVAQEVTSVNVVGYNKIDIGPGKLALVTVPYVDMGTPATLENLIGDQLPAGSYAYIWDRVAKTYVVDSRGRGGWTSTNILERGDAMWLLNAGAETSTVSFLGEVPALYNAGQTSTVPNITSLDAVGYAFPADCAWTGTSLAAVSDILYVWNPTTESWDIYSKGRAGWSTPDGFTIPAGRGFWVGVSAPVDWEDVAPYDID